MKIKDELLGKEVIINQRTILLSNSLRPSQMRLLTEFRPDVFEVENTVEVTSEEIVHKEKKKVKKSEEKSEENETV